MAIISFGDDDEKVSVDKELTEEEKMRASKTIADAKESQYIPPRMLAEMQASYGEVVVHDFGDDYNLSEKEKIEKNKLYKVFSKLGRCKRTYRKLDEFITVARLSMDALNAVAETNGRYEPEEFKKRVFKGKIDVQGWMFPKLAGKERKKVNLAYLAEFILSGEDPKLFNGIVETPEDEFPSDATLIAGASKLFDKDALDKITHVDDEETIRRRVNGFIEDTTDPSQIPFDVVLTNDQDANKKLLKNTPELLDAVKDYRRGAKYVGSSSHLQSFVSDIDYDDFKAIAEADENISGKSSDAVDFHGSITNSDDYYEFISNYDEYAYTHELHNYNGRQKTQAEIDEAEFMRALEDAGWNIKVLFGNKERRKKRDAALRADRQKEKRLKAQLKRVSNRLQKKDEEYKNRRSLADAQAAKKKKKKKKKESEDD